MRTDFNALLRALLQPKVYRATKYLSLTQVVKATRKRYGGKLRNRNGREEIVLTIGKPNWKEWLFLRQCRRAGEPIPVRKIQLHVLAGA